MGTNGAVIGVTLLISGIKPTNVVTDVRTIGRNRMEQDVMRASSTPMPSRRRRFT